MNKAIFSTITHLVERGIHLLLFLKQKLIKVLYNLRLLRAISDMQLFSEKDYTLSCKYV